MNFLNPGGTGGGGGVGGGVGKIDNVKKEDSNYQEKLDDALARREEYEETGDMKKLEGVQKKIEFYESVIAYLGSIAPHPHKLTYLETCRA